MSKFAGHARLTSARSTERSRNLTCYVSSAREFSSVERIGWRGFDCRAKATPPGLRRSQRPETAFCRLGDRARRRFHAPYILRSFRIDERSENGPHVGSLETVNVACGKDAGNVVGHLGDIRSRSTFKGTSAESAIKWKESIS